MNNKDMATKQKSRDYPAVSLKRAVEFARRIYEKDRWSEAPAVTAVRHMGYAGLNGGSRPALSALKKYGLVEYIGAGENLRIKLTDLAKRIFVPLNPTEAADAIWEALNSPQVHVELLATFPNWDLPSDDTLAARLEREFRLQHAAVKAFISDLRESLEYARQFSPSVNMEGNPSRTDELQSQNPRDRIGSNSTSQSVDPDHSGSQVQNEPPGGLLRIPMPGSSTYIVLPESPDKAEAKRILAWLTRVVTPAVEFASEGDETG